MRSTEKKTRHSNSSFLNRMEQCVIDEHWQGGFAFHPVYNMVRIQRRNQDTALAGVAISLRVTSLCCCCRVLLSISVGPPCSSPTAFNCAAMSFRKREFSR